MIRFLQMWIVSYDLRVVLINNCNVLLDETFLILTFSVVEHPE